MLFVRTGFVTASGRELRVVIVNYLRLSAYHLLL